MKKLIKKGFSIIELIFVMVVLVVLAAMAIPSISSEDKKILAQMIFDLREANEEIIKNYINKKDFSLVIPNNIIGAKAIEGTDTYIYKDLTLKLFNKNIIDFKVISEDLCTNKIEGDNFVGNGYEIKIYNTQIPDKAVKFNSCTDNKIKLIDIK